MTLLIAAILVLAFAMFVGSSLRLPTRPATLVGLYLLSYANTVFVSELAATAHLLDYRAFLALHLALAIAAWFFWHRAGQPSLMEPFSNFDSNFNRQSLLFSIRAWPDLWVLGLGVAVAYLVGAYLVLIVPPNNWDSMTYHLSRVGYWLQHNSFYPWPTPNPRQISFPMNAEIGILWTVLFWGTDQLAGFVQWLAVPASMVAIVGLARMLGSTRAQSVFAALIWATFTEIVLQSTTTQNDLVASAFFVSMVYLLYLGLRSNRRGVLLLSGLALGLALGTKATVLFLLPGLALTVIMLWLRHGKQGFRQLFVWAEASLAGFLLVGAYVFALNLLVYGHPLGPPSLIDSHVRSSASRLEMLTTNTIRYLYQAVDPTGLPDAVADPLQKIKADAGTQIFSLLNIPINSTATVRSQAFNLYNRPGLHEDLAWFGPLSFLLLMPAMIYQSSVGVTKKEPYRLGLIAISLSLLLSLSFWQPWTPYKNRYFVLAITICAPFLAPFVKRDYLFGLLRWGIIGLALLVMGWTTVCNEAKPLTGPHAIWELDRISRRSQHWPIGKLLLSTVEQLIPPEATVGTMLGTDDWDYPLFGEHFSRKVVPIYPRPESIDLEWLAEQAIDFLVVRDTSGTYVGRIPVGLYTIGNAYHFYFLYRGDASFAKWDPTIRNQLLSIGKVPQYGPLVTVDSSLAGAVGIEPNVKIPWPIEIHNDHALLWLGHGDEQGLKVALWSAEKRAVQATFDVVSGPGREDSLRTVEATLENETGIKTERQQFDRATTLTFDAELQPGRNELDVKVLEEATILEQPNGDTRPLLVLLRHITVASLFDGSQAGPESYPLITVDPSLLGAVGIDPHLKTSWPIEVYEDLSFLWLGYGDAAGVAGTLWSDAIRQVVLEFEVSPGPSREDQQRTVQLVIQNNGQATRQKETFDEPMVLAFPVQLQAGRNDFRFTVLDEATIPVDGDTRPLLVFLRHITVKSSSQ